MVDTVDVRLPPFPPDAKTGFVTGDLGAACREDLAGGYVIPAREARPPVLPPPPVRRGGATAEGEEDVPAEARLNEGTDVEGVAIVAVTVSVIRVVVEVRASVTLVVHGPPPPLVLVRAVVMDPAYGQPLTESRGVLRDPQVEVGVLVDRLLEVVDETATDAGLGP